jgi:hypothetical protein
MLHFVPQSLLSLHFAYYSSLKHTLALWHVESGTSPQTAAQARRSSWVSHKKMQEDVVKGRTKRKRSTTGGRSSSSLRSACLGVADPTVLPHF